jgi:hypothetical protein
MAPAALHAVHHEEPKDDQQQDGPEGEEEGAQHLADALLQRLDRHGHGALAQGVEELLVGGGRHQLEGAAVGLLAAHGVAGAAFAHQHFHLVQLAALGLQDEVGIEHGRRRLGALHIIEQDQQQGGQKGPKGDGFKDVLIHAGTPRPRGATG